MAGGACIVVKTPAITGTLFGVALVQRRLQLLASHALLVQALEGDRIERGASFLGRLLGARAVSEVLTIADDPLAIAEYGSVDLEDDGRRLTFAGIRRSKSSLIARFEGVPPNIIMGIWGIETNFGSNFGDANVFEALTNLGYRANRQSFAAPRAHS